MDELNTSSQDNIEHLSEELCMKTTELQKAKAKYD